MIARPTRAAAAAEPSPPPVCGSPDPRAASPPRRRPSTRSLARFGAVLMQVGHAVPDALHYLLSRGTVWS
ncbi:hypothetical protein I553_5912 [Mycobacterium xenopi 4042]|uniref:Uncharacterized protein n=1 Tax=Mycobacterium xenopi 4042 TaxID=1299334 RepID=X8BFP2_MYCXE|nr:hypothetical protein I553_5912 [Mycobacterium xenopi 4042]